MSAEVTDGHVVGAVVLVGDANGTLYRHATGDRVVGPITEAMTVDTGFDLASLTKPVATATAVLQLAERGELALDRPATTYWPAFGQHGKDHITVRELLTHTSGLPAGVSSSRVLRNKAAVLRDIVTMSPAAAGKQVLYSDLNYVVLGEIVQRVSGKTLDAWCTLHVFAPLGMHHTTFRPGASNTAPTSQRGGAPIARAVHDPIAAALDGVAGNAGLFSNADDLARYAQMLLQDGISLDRGTRILSHESVTLMFTPATLDASGPMRSVGWAIEAPLVPNRYRTVPAGAVSHLGYTGTGLWVDLVTRRYVVILTSRLYPNATGDASTLRSNVLGALASAAAPMTASEIALAAPTMAVAIAHEMRPPSSRGPVQSGIDVLESTAFGPVAGHRIALITNRSGFDATGSRTIDILAHTPGIVLARIFAPEHGLNTELDTRFDDTVDDRTGLPVHSLFAAEWGIPKGDLADVELLVFDIQDAGVRFFTYIAILGQAMESAAAAEIPIVVLDRPNPLGAQNASGPVADVGPAALTAYHPLALAHGMTVGELAQMFNAERAIGADLTVIRMHYYERGMSYSETGLGWVPPSPNLRDAQALAWYADVGLIEGAAISVGRGTPTPFSVVGAPWIRPELLVNEMSRNFPTLTYTPVRFVPAEGPYAGFLCSGIRLSSTSARKKPGQLGLALAAALLAMDSKQFRVEEIRTSIGSEVVLQALKERRPLADIYAVVDEEVAAFELRRAAFLLY
ncbi:exo-beta-N-acetylmuramidase NamZ domain-containing protein [Cupriavidus pauculus]|uniref:exo-beta-N-acetylmuramidase NamZ domain-containing protein n=1 Tax=Cupriavidus pauculus TaxID=82633 RepID=UPI000AF99DA6|nr:exo-beta-N-acetylmuramidase NamZ domain-containing protein [Cupriavidus pauculus]